MLKCLMHGCRAAAAGARPYRLTLTEVGVRAPAAKGSSMHEPMQKEVWQNCLLHAAVSRNWSTAWAAVQKPPADASQTCGVDATLSQQPQTAGADVPAINARAQLREL